MSKLIATAATVVTFTLTPALAYAVPMPRDPAAPDTTASTNKPVSAPAAPAQAAPATSEAGSTAPTSAPTTTAPTVAAEPTSPATTAPAAGTPAKTAQAGRAAGTQRAARSATGANAAPAKAAARVNVVAPRTTRSMIVLRMSGLPAGCRVEAATGPAAYGNGIHAESTAAATASADGTVVLRLAPPQGGWSIEQYVAGVWPQYATEGFEGWTGVFPVGSGAEATRQTGTTGTTAMITRAGTPVTLGTTSSSGLAATGW